MRWTNHMKSRKQQEHTVLLASIISAEYVELDHENSAGSISELVSFHHEDRPLAVDGTTQGSDVGEASCHRDRN